MFRLLEEFGVLEGAFELVLLIMLVLLTFVWSWENPLWLFCEKGMFELALVLTWLTLIGDGVLVAVWLTKRRLLLEIWAQISPFQ